MALTSAERIVSAQVGGCAQAHGYLRRLTLDEAVAEILELLGQVPADRRAAVLADAAAGYSAANPNRERWQQTTLAVLVAAGADVGQAERAWRARFPRGQDPVPGY
jgi:hypothetical protein